MTSLVVGDAGGVAPAVGHCEATYAHVRQAAERAVLLGAQQLIAKPIVVGAQFVILSIASTDRHRGVLTEAPGRLPDPINVDTALRVVPLQQNFPQGPALFEILTLVCCAYALQTTPNGTELDPTFVTPNDGNFSTAQRCALVMVVKSPPLQHKLLSIVPKVSYSPCD